MLTPGDKAARVLIAARMTVKHAATGYVAMQALTALFGLPDEDLARLYDNLAIMDARNP